MTLTCPRCGAEENSSPHSGLRRILKKGSFRRSSDGRKIRRFFCGYCRRGYSRATVDPFYYSKTRQLNQGVYASLSSNVSQRRTARTLEISRGTVARKLCILGKLCARRMAEENAKRPQVEFCQFDDLETFEHTKLKPLSVTTAVSKERFVLAFTVSSMPCNGRLAAKSQAKYGARADDRVEGRREMFSRLLPCVSPTAQFRSDQNPHYPIDLKNAFPFAKHIATKGRAPRNQGQGELKKGAHDPIFALNHTFASFRANINRLIRKTWCTTKRAERLSLHINLYADYHNQWIQTKRPPQFPEFKLERRRASGKKPPKAQFAGPV